MKPFECWNCGSSVKSVTLIGQRRKGPKAKIERRYRCRTCGHVGFSVHRDLETQAELEKKPPPIKFKVSLQATAYNGKWCDEDCDGFGWGHDGDARCEFWGHYLNTDLSAPTYLPTMYKRCKDCLDAEHVAPAVAGREFPKFAKLCGTEMRMKESAIGAARYFRPAGGWSIYAKWRGDKLLAVGNNDANINHLIGEQLIEITEEEYREGNAGYV